MGISLPPFIRRPLAEAPEENPAPRPQVKWLWNVNMPQSRTDREPGTLTTTPLRMLWGPAVTKSGVGKAVSLWSLPGRAFIIACDQVWKVTHGDLRGAGLLILILLHSHLFALMRPAMSWTDWRETHGVTAGTESRSSILLPLRNWIVPTITWVSLEAFLFLEMITVSADSLAVTLWRLQLSWVQIPGTQKLRRNRCLVFSL